MQEFAVPRLRVEVESRPGVGVLHVHGEVDLETSPVFAAAFARAIEEGAKRVVIDGRDLSYLDSTGISVLVQAWLEMGGRETMPVAVSELRPSVRRVLDICGVTELVTE